MTTVEVLPGIAMLRKEAARVIERIGSDDPERAHGEVDRILLDMAGPEVKAACRRLADRCRWWDGPYPNDGA